MGFWDRFKRRVVLAEQVEESPEVEPTVEVEDPAQILSIEKAKGVSGTALYSGLLSVENVTALQHARAFGTPGGVWGEWQLLEKTDPAVASGLNMVSAPLRDATVSIDPNEADPNIVEFLEDQFARWLDPSIALVIEQLVHYGLGYGFSLHERVMGTRSDPRVPGGVAVYLARLEQRLPESVRADGWITKDGKLVTIRQSGVRDGQWIQVDLDAAHCLLASWRRAGDNYAGVPAFRSVWYIGKLRAQLLKILAIGHQREACGVPVITQDPESRQVTDAELDDIEATLRSMVYHENAYMILPPGLKLDWVFSGAHDKSSVLNTWRALGIAILEVVQAEQQALGTGDTGSRAVGDVKAASQNGFVEGVRAWVEAVLNGTEQTPGIVRELVDMNFGPQAHYPRLCLRPKRPDMDVTQLSTAAKTLSDAGALHFSRADEDHLRERMGLPPADDEAIAAAEAMRAAAQAAFAKQGTPADDGEDGGKDTVPPRVDEKAFATLAAAQRRAARSLAETQAMRVELGLDMAPFMPQRELRPSETVLDLAALDRFFSAARAAFESAAKPVLVATLKAAMPAIEAALADGDPSELEDLELDLTELRSVVVDAVRSGQAFGYHQAAAEVARLRGASATTGFASRRGNLDKAAKATVDLTVKRIEDRTTQQLWDTAISEVRREQGVPMDTARQRAIAERVTQRVVEEIEATGTLRTDAGYLVTRSVSDGREQQFADANVEWLELSAVLDGATCSYCESVDGTRVQVGTPEHYMLTPPLGNCAGRTNCRCLLVPVEGA